MEVLLLGSLVAFCPAWGNLLLPGGGGEGAWVYVAGRSPMMAAVVFSDLCPDLFSPLPGAVVEVSCWLR